MADTVLTEDRLTSLLGVIQHELHDEYHQQRDDGDEGVKQLASDQKHLSDGRLRKLLDIMFPGENVTVTSDDGKTLFSAEEHEEEEESEDEEDEVAEKGEDDDT
jgi:hypothetical protein